MQRINRQKFNLNIWGTQMSFKPVDPKVDFPLQEEEVLKFWQEKDIFKKSISQREGAEDFVFYDGPIYANAKPGIHHVFAKTIKPFIFFLHIILL